MQPLSVESCRANASRHSLRYGVTFSAEQPRCPMGRVQGCSRWQADSAAPASAALATLLYRDCTLQLIKWRCKTSRRGLLLWWCAPEGRLGSSATLYVYGATSVEKKAAP